MLIPSLDPKFGPNSMKYINLAVIAKLAESQYSIGAKSLESSKVSITTQKTNHQKVYQLHQVMSSFLDVTNKVPENLTFSVVAFSPVVSSSTLPEDKVVRAEYLMMISL